MQDKTGLNRKEKIIRAIIVGIITSVVSGIIVTYFELYAKYNWFGEKESQVHTVTTTPTPEILCGAPPDVSDPEIPLKVLEYSSQKDASHPASAAVDGACGTAWISGTFSSSERYLVLSAANELLIDISSVQLCTVPPESPQATMAVCEITLFSSLDLAPPRHLSLMGTYSLSQGQACHHLKFATPITLRVLLIQINKTAGDPSGLVSEVTAYGLKLIED